MDVVTNIDLIQNTHDDLNLIIADVAKDRCDGLNFDVPSNIAIVLNYPRKIYKLVIKSEDNTEHLVYDENNRCSFLKQLDDGDTFINYYDCKGAVMSYVNISSADDSTMSICQLYFVLHATPINPRKYSFDTFLNL